MYDVIIIGRGVAYFTAEKFSVTTKGLVSVYHRELGDVSFLLADDEELIIKPFDLDLYDENGRIY